jgi:hypothetical protein
MARRSQVAAPKYWEISKVLWRKGLGLRPRPGCRKPLYRKGLLISFSFEFYCAVFVATTPTFYV